MKKIKILGANKLNDPKQSSVAWGDFNEADYQSQRKIDCFPFKYFSNKKGQNIFKTFNNEIYFDQMLFILLE